jgi:glutaminyl-tRNA synthetase
MDTTEKSRSLNFIEQKVESDIRTNGSGYSIITRFPPEPNGYLHIGHAKSICLNFGLARDYNGQCNLRFDDTNPVKEDVEYVNSIMDDIRWLGFSWNGEPRYASDYFEQLYRWAELLIQKGDAFVCDCTAEEVSANRGTPAIPATPSPFRGRSVDENLDLFRRMRAGEFPEGSRTLRAKMDLASPNMHMRDPVLYRIIKAHHHRTGDAWCIYPMYDYAHGQSDYIEGITHSICTLEFEIHRPIYDWFLDRIAEPGKTRPVQIEFARLNLTYTVMSKRILLDLVKSGTVNGWDDPRMPTISGLRRRGYTPEAIRDFAARVGVAKQNSTVDMNLLEHCLREDLNRRALRVMAVIRPVKVIITNYPENQTEKIELLNNPEDESAGIRNVPFSRELWIEAEDFMETPVPKYHRLYPGNEVRLRGTYFITCTGVEKNPDGSVKAILCSYDPATRTGYAPDNRKVKGTIHWVDAAHALPAEFRLYDRLFTKEDPYDTLDGADYKSNLNPDSLVVAEGFIEPSVSGAPSGKSYQFERTGYFAVDPDSSPRRLVFNRSVSLKDSWSRVAGKA